MKRKNKSSFLPKRQKLGVFLLIGIGLGVVGTIITFVLYNYQTSVLPLKDNEIIRKQTISQSPKEYNSTKPKQLNFQSFNPNTITKAELLNFGLTQKQADNFVNYLKAGGKFKTKEDLRKLYFMTEDIYNQMSPYINIPKQTIRQSSNQQPAKENNYSQTSTTQSLIFDLNQADTLDLQAIRGIGTSYSKIIVKYRTLLGGYVSLEQLKEVYGMTDSLYQKIIPFLKIENPSPKKLNINTFSIKELSAHPYIDFYLAKAIIKLRYDLKSYTSLQQVRQIHLLDQATYEKLLPYLEL
jgi:DNA uptake protein ComE-like DNA-binding protein